MAAIWDRRRVGRQGQDAYITTLDDGRPQTSRRSPSGLVDAPSSPGADAAPL
jgi:hypothetical protein